MLPAVAQAVWFVPVVPGRGRRNFVALVPFFHSLQYLLIAWGVQMKETLDEAQRATVGPVRADRDGAVGGIVCFAGG